MARENQENKRCCATCSHGVVDYSIEDTVMYGNEKVHKERTLYMCDIDVTQECAKGSRLGAYWGPIES